MELKQSFSEHLQELGAFLRRQMRLVPWIITAAFFLAVAAGYALYAVAPAETSAFIEMFQKAVESAGILTEEGGLRLFPLMFNNWRAMLFSVIYGFVPFLFLPITAIITNGALVGVLAAHYQSTGESMAAFLAGILPHGIFEIAALILSVSLGTLLCFYVVLALFRHKKAISLIELGSNILRTLLLIVFPLVVLSALIETYITPLIMELFL